MDNTSNPNMAGKLVKGDNATSGEREPVNPSATGASMDAVVIKQSANFSKSGYSGHASKN